MNARAETPSLSTAVDTLDRGDTPMTTTRTARVVGVDPAAKQDRFAAITIEAESKVINGRTMVTGKAVGATAESGIDYRHHAELALDLLREADRKAPDGAKVGMWWDGSGSGSHAGELLGQELAMHRIRALGFQHRSVLFRSLQLQPGQSFSADPTRPWILNGSRDRLVNAMAAAVRNGDLDLRPIARSSKPVVEILLRELEDFEATMTQAGREKLAAKKAATGSAGGHDDVLLAAALAWGCAQTLIGGAPSTVTLPPRYHGRP